MRVLHTFVDLLTEPVFCATLLLAAYLGFSLIQLNHDKAIHFTTFFILTAEFFFLWKVFRPWKFTFVVMTLGASILLEYVQNFINHNRRFDYVDILYNVHGSGLALAMCCLVARRRTHIEIERESSPVTPTTSDGEDYVDIRMDDIERM